VFQLAARTFIISNFLWHQW